MTIHRPWTTAYHPSVNELVERFHRQLKAALMARSSNTWVLKLPLVLLGIPSSLKVDLKCSAGELVHGTALCLLDDFFLAILGYLYHCTRPTDLCGTAQVHHVLFDCCTTMSILQGLILSAYQPLLLYSCQFDGHCNLLTLALSPSSSVSRSISSSGLMDDLSSSPFIV